MSDPWQGGRVVMGRRAVPGSLCAVAAAAAVLTGCSAPDTAPVPAPVQAAPPAPPAACLLDPARLAADTGLTWTPDQTTASDTRCVYDPGGPIAPAPSAAAPTAAPDPADFLAVEVAPAVADDAQTELDGVAGACADGSRAPVQDDGHGFVCRFRGGSVFAAAVRAGQLVTVSVSAVPEGTTAARLVLALQQQLDGLGR
jgi:hypothetical protein